MKCQKNLKCKKKNSEMKPKLGKQTNRKNIYSK